METFYKKLKKEVTRNNGVAETGYDICKGSDIDTMAKNMSC
jgi:hypothetical protein